MINTDVFKFGIEYTLIGTGAGNSVINTIDIESIRLKIDSVEVVLPPLPSCDILNKLDKLQKDITTDIVKKYKLSPIGLMATQSALMEGCHDITALDITSNVNRDKGTLCLDCIFTFTESNNVVESKRINVASNPGPHQLGGFAVEFVGYTLAFS